MTPQRRAVARHRRRLSERGFARYEVRGLANDKELVRRFAQRLAANDADAAQLRREIAGKLIAKPPPLTGKDIWDALRRSPLVGANLDLQREVVIPRDINL